MSSHEGHLFVVHGRIGSVVHDAALVPVDRHLAYAEYWRDLVGKRPPRPLQWETRGWGGLGRTTPDRVWAISIGGDTRDPYSEILARVRAAIARISERRIGRDPARGDGTLPLIAVPVIGIGRGGFGRSRGDVLRELVAALQESAVREQVDVALVAPDSAVYAAAQYARRGQPTGLTADLEEKARRIGQQAQRRQLALLMGAGVSVPAGLPTWQKLITELARQYGVPHVPASDKLSLIDQAELIERASHRQDLREVAPFQQQVAERVRKFSRPSLLHALLASLDCREVVTTNYDTLYEQAVEASGRSITTVMPWASAHDAERWVLKLHGDVDHPEQIVLTRRHMVRFDAANRPSAAVLQSLLLTKKLLVVGASMTDDNVIRLAHEVQDYRSLHQPDASDRFGTVIDVNNDELREQLWDGHLEWVRLLDRDSHHGFRTQELFLDHVAGRAARDSSWLLDERFEGLLDDPADRRTAAQARELLRSLPQRDGDKWKPLRDQLRAMGARSAGH